MKKYHFEFKELFRGYPWRTFIIFFSVAVTVFLIFANLVIWFYKEKNEKNLRMHYYILQMHDRMIYHDELSTYLLYLYFMIGETSYLRHYQNLEQKLLNLIQRVNGILKSPNSQVEKANHILSNQEKKALDLYAANKPKEAQDILNSSSYKKAKEAFKKEFLSSLDQVNQTILKTIDTSKKQENLLLLFVAVAVIFYIFSWLVFLLLIRFYSKDFSIRINRSVQNLSHDLRDPIAAIISYSRILLSEMDGSLNKKQTESVRRIGGIGHRLLNMILDILNFSKMESKTISINRKRFDLVELVKECIESILPIAEDKGLTIAFKTSSSSIFIESDESKLMQVINNLISNALKYSEQGEIKVLLDVFNNRICLQIIDQGIGIQKQDLKKIFSPFYQCKEKRGNRWG